MTIRHLFPLSIYILYCVAIIHGILLNISNNKICSVLCKKCNASAILVNNQCECDFNDNNEDVECIQSLQRNILTDLNVFSDNLANKERGIRSALKSRRRLRIGDAEKVAQYFMNGGASAGHSHFIRGSNAICDNTNIATNSLADTIRQSDTGGEFHSRLPTNPLTGIIYKSYMSPLHMLPGAAPMIPSSDISSTKMYTSLLGMVRPISDYPVDRVYPLSPVSDLISLVHTHPYHVLLQTSALPSHILHNLMKHQSHYPPIHHNIDKKLYPQQDNSPTTPLVGQPYENNNNLNHQASSKSLTTGNNTNESVHNSSARTAQMNASHLPMQYRHLISPYRFIPYYSPLFNILYSPFDRYIIGSIPHYFQHASDSTLTSLQNPDTYRTNNTTTEPQAEVPTTVTNKTGYFNDEQTEKADDTTEHYVSVSKEQNET